MTKQELTVITHTHDLRVWTLEHVARFPRTHRHELGRRLLDKMDDLMDRLLEAKFTGQKEEILRQASLRVEELRWTYRAATDLRVLSLKSQGHAISRLQEIGRQLAAWRQSVQRRS